MIEHHIDIKTADGLMNTFITHPEKPGPHPVVLFYMDAPGKREELHDMARRIGTVGYYVVLPNLYYRQDRDFQMVWDEEGRKRMFEHMYQLSLPKMMRDTQAMFDYVREQGAADADHVGAVGYCMSGPFVIAAASEFPDQLKCAASIYGAGLVTDRPTCILGLPRANSTSPAPRLTSMRRARRSRRWNRRWPRRVRTTGSSGIQEPITALPFRRGKGCTTRPPPSVTGSACSSFFAAIWATRLRP